MLRPTGARRQSNPQPSKFEAALRHNEPWPAAKSVTIQSGSETQAALITDNPKVPDADPDREVIWKVGVSAVRFDLSALLAKPVVTRGAELNSKNAVVHSMGTTLCMLARSTDSRFLFSADRAGTYSVAITVSSIDLEPWARRSDASKIPAVKLPPVPRLTVLEDRATIAALDVNDSSDNQVSGAALIPFSTPLDLDDYNRGELYVSLTLTITGGGRTDDIGFTTDNNRTHDITEIVFLSELAAVASWEVGDPVEGLEIGGGVGVYRSNVKLGEVHFYFGRNANNTTGYYWTYQGAAESRTFRTTADLGVSLSPTDAAPRTHVGALVATLAWPAGTPAPDERPGADWVFSSGIPADFDKVGRKHRGAMNVPRVLPESWMGLVVVAKVGEDVVEQVYVPWLPFRTTQVWSSAVATRVGRLVYLINATNDGTIRNIKLTLQREYTLRLKDALFVVGNNTPIKENTSFELRAWV